MARRRSWPLCQLRGRLMEDQTFTAMTDWVPQGEAIAAFNAQIAKMRSHGFRIASGRMAGTVRRAEVINPHGRRAEAIYWVVPDGAASA